MSMRQLVRFVTSLLVPMLSSIATAQDPGGPAAPDWLTVGLASQRTRTYHTGLDVQRGLFVGFSHKNLTLDVYVFNLGWETPTVITSLAVTF
jgi:hypothetical protein